MSNPITQVYTPAGTSLYPETKRYRWYDVSDSHPYLRVFDAQVCTMLRKNIRSWLTGINDINNCTT